MSFWRSPFPFPAKNLAQTGLIRKWIKRFKEQQRDPFVKPNPSSSPGTGLLLGGYLAKIVPSPTCHQSVSDRTRAPCPSFYKQDTQQGRCLWGRTAQHGERLLHFCREGSNLLTRHVCLTQLDRQAIHLSCVWATIQLGIIYYSNCSPLRLTSIFTIKKDDPTLGSWVYFPGDNSRYVVKIVAL